jgi:hypothetical protein
VAQARLAASASTPSTVSRRPLQVALALVQALGSGSPSEASVFSSASNSMDSRSRLTVASRRKSNALPSASLLSSSFG